MSASPSFTYTPIGFLQTCFKEKFGVPRQSLMVKEATAVLRLVDDPRNRLALTGLESFSHVWLVFVFHKNAVRDWRPLIEPPKEDLFEKVGVFASRSPDRPNPIGISAVKLEKIHYGPQGIEIHLSGVDLLDGTPILDLKPYLPYADVILDANSGWTEGEIKKYPVTFSEKSLSFLQGVTRQPRLKLLIEQVLEWDSRPTSQRKAHPLTEKSSEGLKFAFRLQDYDVHWEIRNRGVYVSAITLLPDLPVH